MKRLIRKSALSFEVENDKLYRNMKDGRKEVLTTWRDRLKALKDAHVKSDGCHNSKMTMLQNLSDVTWKGIYSDCMAYSTVCPDCNFGAPVGETNNGSINENEIARIAEKNYSHLIQYLKTRKFSVQSDSEIHRAVLSIVNYFSLLRGQLFYRKSEKSVYRCFEVAAREKKKAIKEAHEESISDEHLGSRETLENLSQKFLWYDMQGSVDTYIQQCCQKKGVVDMSISVSNFRLKFFKDYFAKQEKPTKDAAATETLIMTVQEPLDSEIQKNVKQITVNNEVTEKHSTCESNSSAQCLDESFKPLDSNDTEEVCSESSVCNATSNTDSDHLILDEDKISSSALQQQMKMVFNQVSELSSHHENEDGEQYQNNVTLVVETPSVCTSSDPATASAILSILPQEEKTQIMTIQNLCDLQEKGKNAKKSQPRCQVFNQTDSDLKRKDDETQLVEEGKEDHTYKKNNKSTFECKLCGAKVRGMSKYQKHMYKHTGVKPYECDVCKKRFTLVKSMRLHKRRHTGVYPYLCNICGKKFTSAAGINLHVKNHVKAKNDSIQCEYCERTFATVNRYEKHLHFKHVSKEETFHCEECNKIFTTKRSRNRHFKSLHLGVKHHTCEICGKSFFRKEYFTAHIKQHRMSERHHTEIRPRMERPQTTALKVGVNENVITEVISPVSSQPNTYYSISANSALPDKDQCIEVLVENKFYTISNDDQGTQLVSLELDGEQASISSNQGVLQIVDEEKTSNAYGFPGVQYEIECGGEVIDEETLSATGIVAQAMTEQNFQ